MAIDREKLAEEGAKARYTLLMNEISELRQEFPALDGVLPTLPGTAPASIEAKPRRLMTTARRMSPAQRKAVSQRMRKYWAARRAAKGAR